MRRPLAGVLALALLLAPTAPVLAQAPVPPARFERWAPRDAALAARGDDPMQWLLGDPGVDHRYPGFYIGAAAGLVLGIMGLMWCGQGDSGNDGCSPFTYVLVPLASTALVGTVGALIGGMIPKSHPEGGAVTPQ